MTLKLYTLKAVGVNGNISDNSSSAGDTCHLQNDCDSLTLEFYLWF